MGARTPRRSRSTSPATTRSSTARPTSSTTSSEVEVGDVLGRRARTTRRRRTSPATVVGHAERGRPLPVARDGRRSRPPTRCRRSPRSSTASTRRASGQTAEYDGDELTQSLAVGGRARPASTTSSSAPPTRRATRRGRAGVAFSVVSRVHVRALGRVRRHGARRPLAAARPQRRHADRGRDGADRRGRAAARCRRTTSSSTRRARRRRSGRSTSSARTSPSARRATGRSRRSSPSRTPAAGRAWA